MATTHMVHARKRGQALVEMAITLPLIVTLMLGAADLGRAFYLNIEMAGASRAGMREGIKGAEFGSAGWAHTLASAGDPNNGQMSCRTLRLAEDYRAESAIIAAG